MEPEQNNRVIIRKSSSAFTREQRAGFTLVIVAGGLALVLGILYMGRHLSSPFDIDYSGPQYLSSAEQEMLEILEQKQSDTDGDSLSDYDELNLHNTSPYLEDTDGDGYTDPAELASGTDPTCAPGQICNTQDDITPINTADLFGAVTDSQIDAQQAMVDIQSAISSLSVADIRALLISAGVAEVEVNAMSDAQVQEFFNVVVADLSSSGALDQVIEQSLQ